MANSARDVILHSDDAVLIQIVNALAGSPVREDILRSELRRVRCELDPASRGRPVPVEVCTQVQTPQELRDGIAV